MSRNRLSAYFASTAAVSIPFAERIPALQAAPAAFQTASVEGAMVSVAFLGAQAAWQVDLYRRAYEQAVADLAPPRHLARFFAEN